MAGFDDTLGNGSYYMIPDSTRVILGKHSATLNVGLAHALDAIEQSPALTCECFVSTFIPCSTVWCCSIRASVSQKPASAPWTTLDLLIRPSLDQDKITCGGISFTLPQNFIKFGKVGCSTW